RALRVRVEAVAVRLVRPRDLVALEVDTAQLRAVAVVRALLADERPPRPGLLVGDAVLLHPQPPAAARLVRGEPDALAHGVHDTAVQRRRPERAALRRLPLRLAVLEAHRAEPGAADVEVRVVGRDRRPQGGDVVDAVRDVPQDAAGLQVPYDD